MLRELDIANQVYLYNMAKTGMPVDLRLAFIIELAEPISELVNAEVNILPSLKPGKECTTLRNCLKELINSFGTMIFAKEMNGDYDEFSSTLVNSRVRIMHIKMNIPVRRRRLSGNPGSKSPAEWEA